MAPSVSVVVASHALERLPSLLRTLESVDRQTRPADAVVVGIDHNAELAEAVRRARPDVRVVPNDGPHRGASETRNTGAHLTDTDLIAFLDDDEVADESWLELLVRPFTDGRVVGTGGAYVPRWEGGEPFWFPGEFGWVVGGAHVGLPTSPAEVRNVWSGNMAVRASAFRQVGGFRSNFGKLGRRSRPEDTDFCVRVAAAYGGVWTYLPDAKIYHSVPADRSTFAFFVGRCYAEGRGKIDMRQAHGGGDVLATERDYLTKVIPLGVLRNVLGAMQSLARAVTICIGIAAAAVGAAVSTAAPWRDPARRD